jgi:hypothetical protein
MKYLKKINEDINDKKVDIDVYLVKDIIVELKDEYPNLIGGIFPHSDSLEIKLECNHLRFGEESSSLEYLQSKFKFIELLLSVCERLQDALNVDVRLHNLYGSFEEVVKIWLFKRD